MVRKGPKLPKIDKKNAITFKLVWRSQHDPLIVDETAPQRVWVPKETKKKKVQERVKLTKEEELKRKEEQIKYGVYFDDDYDYLQHLRDVEKPDYEWVQVSKGKKDASKSKHEPQPSTSAAARLDEPSTSTSTSTDKPSTSKGTKNEPPTKSKLMLPSSLFPSHVEEREGMLNKAVLPVGPQPDWDPDVVAALDEDFDFENPENILDDDFITQAGGAVDEEAAPSKDSIDDIDEDEIDDDEDDDDSTAKGSDEDVSSQGGFGSDEEGSLFSNEETKTCFTNYSLTSSVIRRSEGLQTLDDLFEAMYEREYGDDTEIGALDMKDIEGSLDRRLQHQRLRQLYKEYRKKRRDAEENSQYKPDGDMKKALPLIEEEEGDTEEMIKVYIDELSGKGNKEDRLDCESILSTYSNLYNHPKLIVEPGKKPIQLHPKTGLPIIDKPGLTAKKLAELDALNEEHQRMTAPLDSRSIASSRVSQLTALSQRSKNETPEERKQRKAALKEFRRERRAEKKANTQVFKQESMKQHKQEVTNLQNTLKTVKLI